MEKVRRLGCFLIPFLLMYYVFMNPARKLMIPYSQYTVPIMLAVVLFFSVLCAQGKIIIRGYADILQCFSWLAIAIMISVYNGNYLASLKSGGLIQFYVMVTFMFFSGNMGKSWMKYWLLFTEIFAMVYALTTVLFFFNEGLYVSYVEWMFSDDVAAACLEYYSRGWMAGMCAHFSSNGILLAIGIMASFFSLLCVIRQKERRLGLFVPILHIACGLIELYALILSSKRSPLFSAIIAIAVVYVVSKRKNIARRLVILAAIALLFYLAYTFLLPYIPGLSTIVDKTEELSGSDPGIWNGREGLWSRAYDMFMQSPLFGNGFGSYAGYAQETNAITTSAHNYYLQLLAEYGIFGTALYMVAFISSLFQTVSVMMKYGTRMSGQDMLYLSFAFAMQVFTLVYNMTATALMYYHVLIPLFLSYSATRTIRYSYEQEAQAAALMPQPA